MRTGIGLTEKLTQSGAKPARPRVAVFIVSQLVMLALCMWAALDLRTAAQLADAIGFQRTVVLSLAPAAAIGEAERLTESRAAYVAHRKRLDGTLGLIDALEAGGQYITPTGLSLEIEQLTCRECRPTLLSLRQDLESYRILLANAANASIEQISKGRAPAAVLEGRIVENVSTLNKLVADSYSSRLWQVGAMVAVTALLSIFLFSTLTSGALKDETEKRRLAEQLSLLAVHTHEMVVITDVEQRVVWINSAFTKASGYDIEEVRGRVPGHFLQGPETDADSVARIKSALLTGEAVRDLEILNYSKDGKSYWIMLNIMPITDESGKIQQYISLQTDITAERNANKRREQQERFYTALIETAHNAIVVVDSRGAITLFNPAAERIFGHASSDVIGKSLDLILPPSQRGSAHAANINSFGSSLKQSRTMGDRSVAGMRANGEICDLLASISKVEIDGDTRFVAILMDVTLQREQESIRKARDIAESANHAKSLFLANMSHELRTPLNVVIGFSQVLARAQPIMDDVKSAERLKAIETSGRHLLKMIDDILDLAKIEVGALGVSMEPVDLVEIVRASVDQFEALSAEANLTLSMVNESADLTVFSDRTRLRQVLTNLVSNAIKYNRKGGQVAVQISADHPSMRALVRVRDTGMGLTTNQIAHLFEPFNRLGAEAQAIEGSGIGLALVKRLVSAMQGEISVSSAVGVGTEVLIALPLVGEANATASVMPTFGKPFVTSGKEPPVSGNVLYIEDNLLNQDVLRSFVADWPGLHLTVCSDGRAGLKVASEHAFDLILIDINLPDMNGIDVLHELRRDGLRRGIPCIAVSAVAVPHQVQRAVTAGFDGYITKPIDYEHLRATVRSALDR